MLLSIRHQLAVFSGKISDSHRSATKRLARSKNVLDDWPVGTERIIPDWWQAINDSGAADVIPETKVSDKKNGKLAMLFVNMIIPNNFASGLLQSSPTAL